MHPGVATTSDYDRARFWHNRGQNLVRSRPPVAAMSRPRSGQILAMIGANFARDPVVFRFCSGHDDVVPVIRSESDPILVATLGCDVATIGSNSDCDPARLPLRLDHDRISIGLWSDSSPIVARIRPYRGRNAGMRCGCDGAKFLPRSSRISVVIRPDSSRDLIGI